MTAWRILLFDQIQKKRIWKINLSVKKFCFKLGREWNFIWHYQKCLPVVWLPLPFHCWLKCAPKKGWVEHMEMKKNAPKCNETSFYNISNKKKCKKIVQKGHIVRFVHLILLNIRSTRHFFHVICELFHFIFFLIEFISIVECQIVTQSAVSKRV